MKCILYTTKEGGNFRYTEGENDSATIELFSKLKADGYIALKKGDAEPKKEKLAYIVLLNKLDNWDFMIKQQRKEELA